MNAASRFFSNRAAERVLYCSTMSSIFLEFLGAEVGAGGTGSSTGF